MPVLTCRRDLLPVLMRYSSQQMRSQNRSSKYLGVLASLPLKVTVDIIPINTIKRDKRKGCKLQPTPKAKKNEEKYSTHKKSK